jgi:hypothetical protein
MFMTLADVQETGCVGPGSGEDQVAVVEADGPPAGEAAGIALPGAVHVTHVEEQHAGAVQVTGKRGDGGFPVLVVEEIVEHAPAGDRVVAGTQPQRAQVRAVRWGVREAGAGLAEQTGRGILNSGGGMREATLRCAMRGRRWADEGRCDPN